jgi:chromosome segregation ATPase
MAVEHTLIHEQLAPALEQLKTGDTLHMPSSTPEKPSSSEEAKEQPAKSRAQDAQDEQEEATTSEDPTKDTSASGHATTIGSDATARLDALQQERDNLRAEVTQLRESLEQLQANQSDEFPNLREELERSQEEKEEAESQYRNLLSKVNTIRSQLGERLKADAEELELARGRIEELEQEQSAVSEDNERLQSSISDLNSQLESQASEIDTLRSRTTLSTSNWVKERDDLVSREAYVREEYEVARQAMQDWEILATEERARREAADERAQELEDQLNAQKEALERVRHEAETQGSTVDGLQRALRDVQEERKKELREIVEQSQSQLEELRKQVKGAEDSSAELKSKLDTTQKELERALPFEKEVKEKNLLIGKLRHEAVILNDHLTKALRFLKRGKPEDNVDRQLVTNHFLHFLALDRSDPKKFQILGLISALLGWNEQQKEQAGLLRQGAGVGSLRVPVSPFRRTPSTPTLGEFNLEGPGGASRESLAELWSAFLEREAESGGAGTSRRGSTAQSIRSGGMMSPTEGRSRGQSPEVKRKESQGGGL